MAQQQQPPGSGSSLFFGAFSRGPSSTSGGARFESDADDGGDRDHDGFAAGDAAAQERSRVQLVSSRRKPSAEDESEFSSFRSSFASNASSSQRHYGHFAPFSSASAQAQHHPHHLYSQPTSSSSSGSGTSLPTTLKKSKPVSSSYVEASTPDVKKPKGTKAQPPSSKHADETDADDRRRHPGSKQERGSLPALDARKGSVEAASHRSHTGDLYGFHSPAMSHRSRT